MPNMVGISDVSVVLDEVEVVDVVEVAAGPALTGVTVFAAAGVTVTRN
jgi:hypothetical protein